MIGLGVVFWRMEVCSFDGKKGVRDGINGCFDDVKEGLDYVLVFVVDLWVDVVEMLDVVCCVVLEDYLLFYVILLVVYYVYYVEY